MATTTNYGWTTPDDTSLVKDGASAIRTLGTSVDTTTKNLNPETTLGDISFRSSTSNVNTRLGIGGTGTVLTVAGGVPTWGSAAPASATATVATSETTTSATYTNLTTSGPAVTITTGTKALVLITAEVSNSGGVGATSFASYAVSGSTTIAESDTVALMSASNAAAKLKMSSASRPTLTAGSNTFTMKYMCASGTATFANRNIIVIDLGS